MRCRYMNIAVRSAVMFSRCFGELIVMTGRLSARGAGKGTQSAYIQRLAAEIAHVTQPLEPAVAEGFRSGAVCLTW